MSEICDPKNGSCEVCQKPSELKCSACKEVFYCCPEHQKTHWKSHKESCNKPFKVCHSNEMGRYVRATRDLEADEVIFTEAPFVFGPKPHLLEAWPVPCVGCCRLLDEKSCQQCPDCFWPACKPDCAGLKIPSLHGFECRVLRLRPRNENFSNFFALFRFDVLVVLRAFYLQKNKVQKWEEFVNMEAHMDKRGVGSEIFKIVQEKVEHLEENYLKPLKDYEVESNQVIIPQVSGDLIHKIYGILDVNATDFTEEVDAIILYPTTSILEHNCTPNTFQTIDKANNYKLTLRAACGIKKDNCITNIYTHILWGTHARREHLMQVKYFSCKCQRCRDPTELGTFLSALVCLGTEKQPCGGTQLPVDPILEDTKWVCDKCKISLPNEDIMKFVGHLGGEVEKLLEKQPQLEEMEEILGKLLHFLHPNHYLVYSIKHSLVQMYGSKASGEVEISNNLLGEKMKMCEELIAITKKIDPGNARLSLYLGVLLNEDFVGKFKLLSRQFEVEKKDSFSQNINEIVNILKECKIVLTRELQSTPGQKLFDVVCANEQKFLNWMEENHVNVN